MNVGDLFYQYWDTLGQSHVFSAWMFLEKLIYSFSFQEVAAGQSFVFPEGLPLY